MMTLFYFESLNEVKILSFLKLWHQAIIETYGEEWRLNERYEVPHSVDEDEVVAYTLNSTQIAYRKIFSITLLNIPKLLEFILRFVYLAFDQLAQYPFYDAAQGSYENLDNPGLLISREKPFADNPLSSRFRYVARLFLALIFRMPLAFLSCFTSPITRSIRPFLQWMQETSWTVKNYGKIKAMAMATLVIASTGLLIAGLVTGVFPAMGLTFLKPIAIFFADTTMSLAAKFSAGTLMGIGVFLFNAAFYSAMAYQFLPPAFKPTAKKDDPLYLSKLYFNTPVLPETGKDIHDSGFLWPLWSFLGGYSLHDREAFFAFKDKLPTPNLAQDLITRTDQAFSVFDRGEEVVPSSERIQPRQLRNDEPPIKENKEKEDDAKFFLNEDSRRGSLDMSPNPNPDQHNITNKPFYAGTPALGATSLADTPALGASSLPGTLALDPSSLTRTPALSSVSLINTPVLSTISLHTPVLDATSLKAGKTQNRLLILVAQEDSPHSESSSLSQGVEHLGEEDSPNSESSSFDQEAIRLNNIDLDL